MLQVLNSSLGMFLKDKDDVAEQLEKSREENEELKFRLEERAIELEGTKAQVHFIKIFVLRLLVTKKKCISGARFGTHAKAAAACR